MSQPIVKSQYNRNNPYAAILTENRQLNKTGSEKDTRHLVLKIDTEALPYQPGDSLGVLPQNPSVLVDELLARLKLDADKSVPSTPDKTLSLREALTNIYTLNRVGKKFVKACFEKLAEK